MVSTVTAPSPAKRKRGREGAVDMVRSLGLCMLLVIPIWYLAQPPDEAEQRIRVVDQAPDVQAWQASAPSAPAPQGVPSGWQATVSQQVGPPAGLRLGWNTDGGHYVEFAATTGPAERFVPETTGADEPDGTVDVAGQSWQRYAEDDGSVSLVRTVDGTTVVVGTRRSSADDGELRALAESVRP